MKKAVTSGIAALGIAAGSLALAAVNPFGAASAQTDGGTTTTVPAPDDSTTPTTPPNDQDHYCPNMGNDDSGSTTPGANPASFHGSSHAYRARSARF
jgi:hypothetical protein